LVGQSLTSIGLGLDLLQYAESAEEAQLHRNELQRILQATVQEIRGVMRMVRPEILDDLGAAAAIRQLIRDFASELSCHFDSQLPLGIRYSEELETAIFRIVEEGLRNVLQHANATQAWVQLAGNDHFLRLSVRDNGCGFRWSRDLEESGMGLAGIRCRVEILQGSLEIVSQVGSGTSLHICLPVSARNL
jgi:two-component system sensor histidine kinase NreB